LKQKALLSAALIAIISSSCATARWMSVCGYEWQLDGDGTVGAKPAGGPPEDGGSIWRVLGVLVGTPVTLTWDIVTLIPQWALGFYPYGERAAPEE